MKTAISASERGGQRHRREPAGGFENPALWPRRGWQQWGVPIAVACSGPLSVMRL